MSEWVTTFQGVVLAYEYDATSYMNSRLYSSRFDQATWLLLQAVGLTPGSMQEKGLRIAIVRENFQFLRELRGGELVSVRSGFLAVGKKYFRFLHQMLDSETNELLATCNIVAVQADRKSNRSVELSNELADRAKAYLVTENAPDRALPH